MTDSENYGGSKQESDSGFASYGLLEKAISNGFSVSYEKRGKQGVVCIKIVPSNTGAVIDG